MTHGISCFQAYCEGEVRPSAPSSSAGTTSHAPTSSVLSDVDNGTVKRRRRLLSEIEAPLAADSNACSVEDVLQLLQLLYAVSRDTSAIEHNNMLGKYSTSRRQLILHSELMMMLSIMFSCHCLHLAHNLNKSCLNCHREYIVPQYFLHFPEISLVT